MGVRGVVGINLVITLIAQLAIIPATTPMVSLIFPVLMVHAIVPKSLVPVSLIQSRPKSCRISQLLILEFTALERSL
jgi:hypothetical protein